MKNNFIFLALICIIAFSCSYDFSPDNFIEIEPPSTNIQYIELNEFTNLDTINVQSVLRYRFTGKENQTRKESNVFIDNQQINSGWEGGIGTFTLNPSNYGDGIHTIRIEHTFNSGSGSIADQAGIEILKETIEYQFVVNRKPSIPPEILSADIVDGTIFVKWKTDYETDFINAYLSLKFKSREIKIPLTEEALGLGVYNDASTVLFVGDSNTPNYDEYSSVSYSILFESEFEELNGLSKSLSFDPLEIKVELAFVDFNNSKLKWSKHPMYANFDMFEFFIQDFDGSSAGGEYLLETPYVFGQEYTVILRPKNTALSLPFYSFRNIPLDDETFGKFELDPFFVKNILYSPNTSRYYSLIVEGNSSSDYKIYIYEYSEDMEFLQKKFIAIYDNIRHEYLDMVLDQANNNFYLDARGSAYKIDGTTLEVLDQYKDPPLTSEVALRENILVRLDYSNNVLTITNTETNTTLYSGFSPNSRLGYFSSNGEYILISSNSGNILYKIVGAQLINVMDFTSIIISKNIQIVDDILYYGTNNDIYIVNLSTNETKSFNFGNTQQYVQYDSISQKLLVSQNGSHIIYNTINEEIISFQSEDDKFGAGNEDREYMMHLQNRRLIHTKGIYIDIN